MDNITEKKGTSGWWADVYLQSIPFMSLFAFSSTLLIPVLVSAIVGFVMMIRNGYSGRHYSPIYGAIPIVWLLGVFAIALSPSPGEKNLNHSLAFLVSSILYLFLPLLVILPRLSPERICKNMTFSLAVASAYIISEFIFSNSLNIRFADYLPYGHEVSEDATFWGQYIRPRGYAVEAGHMALLFEVGIPLFIAQSMKTGINLSRWVLGIFILAGYLLLISAASVCSLAVASALIACVSMPVLARVTTVTAICALAIAVGLSTFARELLDSIIGIRLSYFTWLIWDEGTEITGQARATVHSQALDLSVENPFGWGWGTGSQLASEGIRTEGMAGGFLNLYAEVALACGWLGLVIFLVFMYKVIAKAMHARTAYGTACAIGACSIAMHYFFVANYWYPIFWLPFVLSAGALYHSEAGRSLKHDSISDRK